MSSAENGWQIEAMSLAVISDTPNVSVDKDYDMAALMEIAAGEELTIDSSKFSEQPYKNGK